MRRLQDATLWTKGPPDITGKYSYSAPIALKVRWEDVNELFIGGDGREQRSTSRVYVDRQIALGDYLYKGVSVDATPPVDALEVKAYREIPNLTNTRREMRVML